MEELQSAFLNDMATEQRKWLIPLAQVARDLVV